MKYAHLWGAALLLAGSLSAANWSVGLVDGTPRLLKDGKVTRPFFFTTPRITKGNALETENSTAQIRLSRAAGNHLYSFVFRPFWAGAHDPDAEAFADHLMGEILKNDPDALVMPRVLLDSSWVAARDFSLRNLSADGSREQPSLASKEYRAEAKRALRDLIRYLEKKYPGHLFGYHPGTGSHGEHLTCGFGRRGNLVGYDKSTVIAFREYLTKKYGSDTALQKAWNDPDAKLGSVLPPPPAERSGAPQSVWHDPASQAVIDFNFFYNELMVDTALGFAATVREECGKTRIVTLFYGYLFECMAQMNGPAATGSYALSKMLASPDVDILAGPYSYSNLFRVPGGAAFTHTTPESITAAGKLWFNEEDISTHRSAARREYCDGGHRMTNDRSLYETAMMARRDLFYVMSHNEGTWWFDLHSHGMWNDPALWEEWKMVTRLWPLFLNAKTPYEYDITLTFSEKSAMYMVSSETPRLTNEGGVSNIRGRVANSGCTSATWLLEDVAAGRAPEKKLDVHPFAAALSQKEREALKARASRVPTIWMGTPGYIDTDRKTASLENVKDLTGFSVRRVQPAFWTCWATPDGIHAGMLDTFGWGKTAGPVLSPVPEKGDVVLAYWRDLWGVPAVVYRPARDGKPFALFCGAVDLPAATIRHFAELAGAHLYLHRNAAVNAGCGCLAVTVHEGDVYCITTGGSEPWVDALTGEKLGTGPRLNVDFKKYETRILCPQKVYDQLPRSAKGSQK